MSLEVNMKMEKMSWLSLHYFWNGWFSLRSLLEQNQSTFEEAVQSENWKRAMDSEINDTWTLTDLPQGAKSI